MIEEKKGKGAGKRLFLFFFIFMLSLSSLNNDLFCASANWVAPKLDESVKHFIRKDETARMI
ncbi:hypothetical protein A5886_001359 [Enterococcus sp. 8G7_MSG3316]|uniref:Uncharacterized protein n=1 Tax=Candidatus Enterococcus testudinis TaxID=1834191 RepID=A0A242A5P8_9ENTE|nr:hypothetical protein [Enterococcus sp. 8G7_MSG3316]OTN76282.1 hypothetical protein A5886_001359 [Enterococcus sp. 8G7_MSG3316]